MLQYPVKLTRDTNNTLLVEAPDFPEVATFGETEDEALAQASDAIETIVIAYMQDRREIPGPSALKRGMRLVTLPALAEAKIALYSAMRDGSVTKAELGRRLGCHPPQVERLLDLRHGSKLEQLEAAFRVLGKRLDIQVRDAA